MLERVQRSNGPKSWLVKVSRLKYLGRAGGLAYLSRTQPDRIPPSLLPLPRHLSDSILFAPFDIRWLKNTRKSQDASSKLYFVLRG